MLSNALAVNFLQAAVSQALKLNAGVPHNSLEFEDGGPKDNDRKGTTFATK